MEVAKWILVVIYLIVALATNNININTIKR